MNIFKKIKFLIDRDGLLGFIKLVFRLGSIKIGDYIFWPWNKKKLNKLVKGKKVIVISKTIEWNYAFQRTQQIAVQFSKNDDVFVLYVTKPEKHDYFFNMKRINDSLYCFSYKHYTELNEVLTSAESVVLYMTNLKNYDNDMKLEHDKFVYEYIDELSVFFDDIEYGRKLHDRAVANADLIVTTAVKLYEETKDVSNHVILSENAGDYDFFSKTKTVEPDSQIIEISKKYDCTIGYYGMLADWFDFDILIEIAKEKKNWAWILIGPTYPTHDISHYHLEDYDNIYLLGHKPYKELPKYIKNIDILTIPFKLNDITASTSPVKLFEYMAASKPIITSDMIECRRYESVNIYHSKAEFIELIGKLTTFEGEEKDKYFEQLEVDAKNNTWAKRATQILTELFK